MAKSAPLVKIISEKAVLPVQHRREDRYIGSKTQGTTTILLYGLTPLGIITLYGLRPLATIYYGWIIRNCSPPMRSKTSKTRATLCNYINLLSFSYLLPSSIVLLHILFIQTHYKCLMLTWVRRLCNRLALSGEEEIRMATKDAASRDKYLYNRCWYTIMG